MSASGHRNPGTVGNPDIGAQLTDGTRTDLVAEWMTGPDGFVHHVGSQINMTIARCIDNGKRS